MFFFPKSVNKRSGSFDRWVARCRGGRGGYFEYKGTKGRLLKKLMGFCVYINEKFNLIIMC